MKTSYYTVLLRDGAPSNCFASYRIRVGLDWGEFVDRHGIKWSPLYVEDTRKRAKWRIQWLVIANQSGATNSAGI